MDGEKFYETGKIKTQDSKDGCVLCPRQCHALRGEGRAGACHETEKVRVARAALHMWEEPCISGESGSGTVFFTGCALGCIYCQNRPIASGEMGKEVSVERLAEIFLELQHKGAKNINLVTAGHFVPQIVQSLSLAKQQGMHLTVVYNSSGYEKGETLRMLEGLVDVYLPDFKYMDADLAERYSGAPDYTRWAAEALEEMVRQAGEPVFDREGMMVRGVIVRHLILPGHTQNSMDVLRYLYENYRDRIYISIMNQYTPMKWAGEDQELSRRVTRREYERVVNYALELGIVNGFIQEGSAAQESFIPAFDCEGV